jgi:hypothetical protein
VTPPLCARALDCPACAIGREAGKQGERERERERQREHGSEREREVVHRGAASYHGLENARTAMSHKNRCE